MELRSHPPTVTSATSRLDGHGNGLRRRLELDQQLTPLRRLLRQSESSRSSTAAPSADTNGYIGDNSGSAGTVTVDGFDSTWSNSSGLYVGYSGNGTLKITGGGAVSNTYCYIGC